MRIRDWILTGAAACTLALAAFASGTQQAAAQYRTMWEGFHVGGAVGWVGSDYNIRQTAPASPLVTINDTTDGVIGGIIYGTSWQRDGWVVGTDSDFSWADARTGANVTAGGLAATADTDWNSSMRVRAGHLIGHNLLLYGTVGVGWSRLKVSGPLIASGSSRRTLTGIQFGGGVEYMTQGRWFARLEYLRSDYGSRSFAEVGGGRFHVDLDTDVVRGAIGYRFDWSWFDLLK